MKLLSKKEKEQFSLFLKSSINDKQLKIYILYECICKNLSSEKTWEKLFPNIKFPTDPFSNSKYRKLEFQLNTYLETFLATQAFLEDKMTRDLFLIKSLNKHKASKLFDAKLKKIKSRLEKKPIRDESYFRIQYQLDRENQHFRYKKLLKAKGSIAPLLSDSFDTWWLHEKLRIAISNLNHEHVTGKHVPNPLFEEILAYVRKLPFDKHPVLHVYRVLYETLALGSLDLDLHAIIYKQKELFREDALKDIFTTTLNYYGRLVSTTGKQEHLEKLFELYKWGFEDQLVFKDGFLIWDHYKNFTTIGLRLKKYSIIFEFIEQYKNHLPEDYREEAYRFSLAQYYFTQHNFKQVIKLLNLKFSNVYYELKARLLVLQSHYELASDSEDLLRNLRSLRIFIQRQKTISDGKKETEINRLKFFEKLIKAYSMKDYNQLFSQISKSKSLSNKQWFLEKIEKGKMTVRI